MSSELPPPHRVAPPSGTAPPTAAPSPVPGSEAELDLVALAAATCDRYYAEYVDEDAVYGEVGRLWCQHDLQHLLSWAALDAAGAVTLETEVAWLARVLESRGYPLPRLARALELAADVVLATLGADAEPMARALRGAATMIVERGTFLED
ncbi:MAG TPA: hypothetical protein VI318_18715 [Baekduia sp.]